MPRQYLHRRGARRPEGPRHAHRERYQVWPLACVFLVWGSTRNRVLELPCHRSKALEICILYQNTDARAAWSAKKFSRCWRGRRSKGQLLRMWVFFCGYKGAEKMPLCTAVVPSWILLYTLSARRNACFWWLWLSIYPLCRHAAEWRAGKTRHARALRHKRHLVLAYLPVQEYFFPRLS